MNFKKKILALVVVLITMVSGFGMLVQKPELNKIIDKITGDYEIPFPFGLKDILYIRYYVSEGKFYQKEIGVEKKHELFPEGDTGYLFKSPSDGFYHKFITNKEGKVVKIEAENKKRNIKLEGLKLPLIKTIKVGEKFSKKALIADFDQLVRTIKYLHPSFYDYTPKEEFDQALKIARNKLIQPLSINGFYKIISPILAKIGCAHSWMKIPDKYRLAKTNTYFPFDVHLREGKLIITRSLKKKHSHLKGAELQFINGKSIKMLAGEILDTLSADWKNRQFKTFLFNRSFKYYLNYCFGNIDSFKIEYLDNKQKIKKSIRVLGISRAQIKSFNAKAPKHPFYEGRPYSLTFLKDGTTALLHISHFEFYQQKEFNEIKSFIDESFSEIKKRKIKNLLLDIRGNMGGAPPAGQYLLSYLIGKPFKYFSKFHKEGGEAYRRLSENQNPHKNSFSGNLITLIDNGCLSTSGHFIALLKFHQAGKLAGLKTGTTFTCTDGSTVKYLRNTGIWVKIARDRFSVAVSGFKPDEGIAPDHKIDLTLKDLLDERDLQLEKALKLFKEN